MTFSYKKIQDTFYIYKRKRSLKTPGGYDVATKYVEIAKMITADLNETGNKQIDYFSSYSYQCIFLDFFNRIPKNELLREINKCFIIGHNWTETCPATDKDEIEKWSNIYGPWKESKKLIKWWLKKLSRIQLCAVYCLAHAVETIHIPYLLNQITENIPPDDLPAVKTKIKKLADYVSQYYLYKQKNDLQTEFITFYYFYYAEINDMVYKTALKNMDSQQYNQNDILSKDESKHNKFKFNDNQSLNVFNCEQYAIYLKSLGDRALINKDFSKAQNKYIKAMMLNPDNAEVWNNLGNIYIIQYKYDKALYAFERAIEIDDIYGKALLGKAITLKNLGYMGGALILYDDILSLYSDPRIREMKQELLDQLLISLFKLAKIYKGMGFEQTIYQIKNALQGHEDDIETVLRFFDYDKHPDLHTYFTYLNALKGSKNAQYSLSHMYYEKIITGNRAIKEAIYWMTKAADEGSAIATGELGYLYIRGSGTEEDIKKGLELAGQAARQGDHLAIETLADCYYNNTDVDVNWEMVKKYWLKSAKKGNETAIENLKKYYNIT